MKSTLTSILFEFENKIKIVLSWKKKKKPKFKVYAGCAA